MLRALRPSLPLDTALSSCDKEQQRELIRKILFPVDFSPSCSGMAAYVRQAAQIFSAEVTVMHVCDLESHNAFELYVRTPNEISEEHWEVGRLRLDGFLSSHFAENKCSNLLAAGEVAGTIVATAERNNFDLIVMPTHAGTFRRMLLGSTVAKVLDLAACPVMTAQHAAMIKPRPIEHKKWLCGIELNADAERVLRVANQASLQAGAKLSLVHVIPRDAAGTFRADEQQAHEWIPELLENLGAEANVSVVQGDIAEQLLSSAEESSADVLVIGRRHGSGALGRLRDLSYSLIRDAPCPVVSV